MTALLHTPSIEQLFCLFFFFQPFNRAAVCLSMLLPQGPPISPPKYSHTPTPSSPGFFSFWSLSSCMQSLESPAGRISLTMLPFPATLHPRGLSLCSNPTLHFNYHSPDFKALHPCIKQLYFKRKKNLEVSTGSVQGEETAKAEILHYCVYSNSLKWTMLITSKIAWEKIHMKKN